MLKSEEFIDQPWYFGKMDREGAEKYLVGQPKGSYVVRPSTTPGCLTLSRVNSSGVVVHGEAAATRDRRLQTLFVLLRRFDSTTRRRMECRERFRSNCGVCAFSVRYAFVFVRSSQRSKSCCDRCHCCELNTASNRFVRSTIR